MTVYKTLSGLLRFSCDSIENVSYERFMEINEIRLENWPVNQKSEIREYLEFGKMIKKLWRDY